MPLKTRYELELQRHGVTVSEFLSYVKSRCKQAGIDCFLDKEEFLKPSNGEYVSMSNIVGNEKHNTRTTYEINSCGIKVPSTCTTVWTDEEGYGTLKAELIRCRPCDVQTYVLYQDGTMYNEIAEFTADSDGQGYGYYYAIEKVWEEE